MPEKINDSPSLTFAQRVVGKTISELDGSIQDRQSLLDARNFTRPPDKLAAEIAILKERSKYLNCLLNRTDIDEIEAGIKRREEDINKAGKNPDSQWVRKAKMTELDLLRLARKREMYILSVNAKTPDELEKSIGDREKLLQKSPADANEVRKINHELEVLKKRQAELHRHQNKTNPREIAASIGMRKRMLGEIKGESLIAILKRAKLNIEIKILEDLHSDLDGTRHLSQTAVAVRGKEPAFPKKVIQKEESAQSSERKGRHGVILTKLVEDGVIIDGTRLRQGLDIQRAVSEKSRDQYKDDLRDLFSPALTPTEQNLRPAEAREKIKLAKEQRAPLLMLIAAAYMPANLGIWNFLRSSLDYKYNEEIAKKVLPAFSYLRYLVENRVGNALDAAPAASIAGLGDPAALENELKKIFLAIKKDPKNEGLFTSILRENLPTGVTPQLEERDTLHLGLLLRQFKENAKARKEHKIDELVKRLS